MRRLIHWPIQKLRELVVRFVIADLAQELEQQRGELQAQRDMLQEILAQLQADRAAGLAMNDCLENVVRELIRLQQKLEPHDTTDQAAA
jgi:hypothetical protein